MTKSGKRNTHNCKDNKAAESNLMLAARSFYPYHENNPEEKGLQIDIYSTNKKLLQKMTKELAFLEDNRKIETILVPIRCEVSNCSYCQKGIGCTRVGGKYALPEYVTTVKIISDKSEEKDYRLFDTYVLPIFRQYHVTDADAIYAKATFYPRKPEDPEGLAGLQVDIASFNSFSLKPLTKDMIQLEEKHQGKILVTIRDEHVWDNPEYATTVFIPSEKKTTACRRYRKHVLPILTKYEAYVTESEL